MSFASVATTLARGQSNHSQQVYQSVLGGLGILLGLQGSRVRGSMEPRPLFRSTTP
jgi:hypothetical protein